MSQRKSHTVVLHLHEDLEALTMLTLARNYVAVRRAIGLRDDFQVKDIPSGAPRAEDFPELTAEQLTADGLAKAGYCGFDCGGGEFDQHGQQALGHNNASSLELLLNKVNLVIGLAASGILPEARAEFEEIQAILTPFLKLVAENDLTAQDIAAKHDFRQSGTPHTPRHLRNVIHGWNLMFPDQPEEVRVRGGLLITCLIAVMEKNDAAGLGQPMPINELMVLDNLVKAMADLEVGFDLASLIKELGEAGLRAMENAWQQGVRDYWNSGTFGFVAGDQQVVVGRSASPRFGAVCRLGNVGTYRHKRYTARPYETRPERGKADIVVQIFADGKFLISSRRAELERVAAELRARDLEKRGLQITAAEALTLSRRGSLTVQGETALYLAEHGKAVGNAFYSNPHMTPCPLTIDEIRDAITAGLGEGSSW